MRLRSARRRGQAIRWILPVVAACSRSASVPATGTSASASTSTRTGTGTSTSTGTDAGATDAHRERAFALPADPSCHGDLRCLVASAYAADPRARTTALALFDETGDVAGTEHEQRMDGGFRGMLHVYPALPTGDDRVQLDRVLAATRDFDDFFRHVDPHGRYRWRDLSFRFFRSASGSAGHEVPRTTPSAYALGPQPMPRTASDPIGFSLAFNVKGSLLRTGRGVRETLFHEIFHMNDDAHGDWSPKALSADYDAIVKRCGAMNVRCLRPYAPGDTMVRGGTYYAFEPNNGRAVREYAAELALRWYEEQRAVLHKQPPPRPFKCGPPENRRAWDALVKEFFAMDLVPPCP